VSPKERVLPIAGSTFSNKGFKPNFGKVPPPDLVDFFLGDTLTSLKESERKRLKYVDFEAFLKAWSSYLRIQEDLERLRTLAPTVEDQDAIRAIEVSLLEISKRIFRKLRAVGRL